MHKTLGNRLIEDAESIMLQRMNLKTARDGILARTRAPLAPDNNRLTRRPIAESLEAVALHVSRVPDRDWRVPLAAHASFSVRRSAGGGGLFLSLTTMEVLGLSLLGPARPPLVVCTE